MGHEMTRSVVSVLVTGFRRQRLNHDAAAPPLGSSRSNPFEDSCSHAQASSTRLRILRRCSNLSNMLAVAAPAETFASAFQMTCASEGYAVNLTLVARAFEFMDAGRQQRRIHGFGMAPLFARASRRSRIFPVACDALFSWRSAGPSERSLA